MWAYERLLTDSTAYTHIPRLTPLTSLDMAVRYADLPDPPAPLPSGWAALLCLYGIR